MTPAPEAKTTPETEWTPEAVREFWGRRQPIDDPWASIAVSAGVLVTFGLLVVMYDLVIGHPGQARWQARAVTGATLGLVTAAGSLTTWWSWRQRDVSVAARAAVVLVAVHLAIAVSAWGLWAVLGDYFRYDGTALPLIDEMPVAEVTLALALTLMLIVLGTGAPRRGTAPRWLAGVVVYALAFLLLLAVWTPLVIPDLGMPFIVDPRATLLAMAPSVVIPPAIYALVPTLLVVLRPAWIGWVWPLVVAATGMLFVAAIGARSHPQPEQLLAYGNFVPLLVGTAVFAAAAIALLAFAHARALLASRDDAARPAPWVQRGLVVPVYGDEVAQLIVDGYLGGMRTQVDAFTLRTARGDHLIVAAGARLVAPVPAWTMTARAGERRPILRAGDEVIVSGFVESGGDGPFRAGALPIAGDAGLVVTVPRRGHETISRDVLLLVWRSCVVFVAVVLLAALPGLVGAAP